MRVLGIDPGIALCGYGVVEENSSGDASHVVHGAIDTPPHMPVEKRLQVIYRQITALIAEYEPVSAGIEKLLFGKNVTNAIIVGQARGVVLLAIANAELPVMEYTPAEVKQAVAGYGDAPKPQMQEMVRILLQLERIPKPDDAADALAVAITHLHAARYHGLTG